MSGTWWTKIHQEGLAKWWKEPQPFSSLPADWILSSSHLLSFFNKVFPADVSHDPRCQSVPHHIHHGPEAIPEYSSTKDKHSFFFLLTSWCTLFSNIRKAASSTSQKRADLLFPEKSNSLCCFFFCLVYFKQKLLLTKPSRRQWWEWCHRWAGPQRSVRSPW